MRNNKGSKLFNLRSKTIFFSAIAGISRRDKGSPHRERLASLDTSQGHFAALRFTASISMENDREFGDRRFEGENP
jgi:hypothetical protein